MSAVEADAAVVAGDLHSSEADSRDDPPVRKVASGCTWAMVDGTGTWQLDEPAAVVERIDR